MTYQSIDQLMADPAFGGRVRACCLEQANTFKDSQLPDVKAVAGDVLRGDADTFLTFIRLAATAPGLADTGATDQSRIPDADILSVVQGDFPLVASLYYDDDGTPLTP